MDIQRLLARFDEFLQPDFVVSPASREYDGRRRVWNGAIDRRPVAILRPNSSEDVARIIRIAVVSNLPLSIRGGGHSFPGFSTCDGGIVIDLAGMAQVTVDPTGGTAEVGGGALLGDLDRATAPFGLVVPAGVVSHTGAGGLTLGGGMGWTSRRFGMTVDNLLGVELVTAEGEVRQVNAETDPDLFWGLRGGGGNFGVVTKFIYRTHELGKVTVGTWSYPPERRAEALLVLGALARQVPRTVTISIGANAAGLHVTAFHSGFGEDGESLVSACAMLAGPGIGGISRPAFTDFQKRSDEGARWGRRYYGRGGFIGSIDASIARTVSDIASSAPTADAEVYMIQLGGAVSDMAEDATAYANRAAGFFWLVQPIWDDASEDELCLAWGRKQGALLAAKSQTGNYLNEQGETGKDTVMLAYGVDKYRRLAKLKARVDPNNLFRLNQNIEPAR